MTFSRAPLVAHLVKNPPATQETWVLSLGWEDPLAEGMATHSCILAWRIPTDRGAWWATVLGVTKSQTRLSDFHFTFPHNSLQRFTVYKAQVALALLQIEKAEALRA